MNDDCHRDTDLLTWESKRARDGGRSTGRQNDRRRATVHSPEKYPAHRMSISAQHHSTQQSTVYRATEYRAQQLSKSSRRQDTHRDTIAAVQQCSRKKKREKKKSKRLLLGLEVRVRCAQAVSGEMKKSFFCHFFFTLPLLYLPIISSSSLELDDSSFTSFFLSTSEASREEENKVKGDSDIWIIDFYAASFVCICFLYHHFEYHSSLFARICCYHICSSYRPTPFCFAGVVSACNLVTPFLRC